MTKKSTSPAKAAQAAKASSKESSSAKNSPNASPERNSSSSSSFVKSSPSRKPAAATDPILKPALAPPPSSNGTAASAKANSSSNSSNGHANANANGHHYPLVNGSAGSSTSIVDVRAAPCSSIAATPSAASVALPPKFVDRNTFKVLQTVDGRILVEYPVRKWLSTATASSHASTSYYDPTDYLVVDTNSIFVQGVCMCVCVLIDWFEGEFQRN